MLFTYHLISAHNCHDAQRLHAELLWVEVDEAFLGTSVAEDNIRMNVCVQVINTKLFNVVLERSLWNGVLRCIAASVSIYRHCRTIAVNVHVCQFAASALQVNNSLAITAVGVRFDVKY